jgi:hypothetical protein
LADARNSPLQDATVDAVVTSPPYINVFNYHQNYRFAAELLGWRPLEAAASEIGANRKHRTNRFFTVIQYCLDMEASLLDIARVMKSGSPLVLVLGRTSNVLGTSFLNSEIFRRLIELSNCFDEIQQAERVFVNRFGVNIYEDILICRRNHNKSTATRNVLEIGLWALTHGLASVPTKNRSLLEAALMNHADVRPSPLLQISIPESFRGVFQ